ncbi:MAG: hypothetical protein OEZ34_13425, partial [Spirochaetia bacterium]|nr:hypothetical protein [Spirochaetia bacterium]
MQCQNSINRSSCKLKIYPYLSEVSLVFLFLNLLLYVSCGKKPAFDSFLSFFNEASYLSIDYAGQNLMTDYQYSLLNKADLSNVTLPKSSWPAVGLINGTVCIQSHSEPFYSSESGLRFKLCSGSFHQEPIAHIFTESRSLQTSYPIYENQELAVKVMTPAQIRKNFRSISVSFDGSLNGNLKKHKLSGSVHYSANHTYSEPYFILRKFPNLYFHILETENHILFLYELPEDKNRYLVVARPSPPNSHERSALLKIRSINQKIAETAAVDSKNHPDFMLSEIYFGKQGGAGSEFFELANDSDQPSLQSVHIIMDGITEYKKDILLLPESVYLLKRKNNELIRFQERISLQTKNFSTEYSYSSILQTGLSSYRSINRESAGKTSSQSSLHPSLHCRTGTHPCSSEGFHPSLVVIPEEIELPESSRRCTTNDFSLSETNPFGIIEGNESPLNPSGKFIEITAHSNCINTSIVFYSHPAVLDTGIRPVSKNEIFLFTADPSYFSAPEIFKNSYLRSIVPATSVSAIDLTTGERKFLKSEDSDSRIYLPRLRNHAGKILGHSL